MIVHKIYFKQNNKIIVIKIKLINEIKDKYYIRINSHKDLIVKVISEEIKY